MAEKKLPTVDELIDRNKELEEQLESVGRRAHMLAGKLAKIREALEGVPGLPATAYKLLR